MALPRPLRFRLSPWCNGGSARERLSLLAGPLLACDCGADCGCEETSSLEFEEDGGSTQLDAV